ncbi:MAG: hypothetical protein K2W95_24905 [Candidatus Obscuribacterales bacterium]|nr:hypothetical protein [Candidatus Obscuribacterales bacterium]
MELQTYHSELLPAVTGVLAFANHSNPANRILLLTGIQQFFCVDDANVGDRQALATLLFAALNVELRRPLPEQSHEFQVRLIELVELHPHPASTALFAVVSDCHHDQHLRKVAQRANVRLMDTLGLMWRRTIVDQVSSSEFLSDHMQAIFDNSLSDLDKAQAIFNACKQKVSAKPSDLRLTLLKRCMSTSDSALLRIASSMAFWHMQSNGRISLPGSWRSAVESMEVCANS